jgi:peptide deformylase
MKRAGKQEMEALGIVQHPDPVLSRATVPYRLPEEANVAQADFEKLRQAADAVFAKHQTKKGLGVAAPQIAIGRRIAILRPWMGDEVCLLNARIVSEADASDLKYEGCLSLFDVRGLVRRSRVIEVEGQGFDGRPWRRTFVDADARLVAHELDHLDGKLYLDRVEGSPISVDEYRRMDNTDWSYDGR